jgi:hypothetical protein
MNSPLGLGKSSQFDNKIWLEKIASSNGKENVNMFISQLTLYDENQERRSRDSSIYESVANILLPISATQVSV